MIFDTDALEAAGKAVGSTDIARVAITTYLDTIADKLDGKIEFRELGPMSFPEPDPLPQPEQP